MSTASKSFRRQALRWRTRAAVEPSPAARREYELCAAAYETLARELERLDLIRSCFAYLGSEPL